MGFNRLPRCCSKADLPDGDYVHVRDDDYCWASALRPVVFLLAIPSLLLLVVAHPVVAPLSISDTTGPCTWVTVGVPKSNVSALSGWKM